MFGLSTYELIAVTTTLGVAVWRWAVLDTRVGDLHRKSHEQETLKHDVSILKAKHEALSRDVREMKARAS